MEYVKLFRIDFNMMVKSVWLVTKTVTNSAFDKYVKPFNLGLNE